MNDQSNQRKQQLQNL